MAKAKPSIEGQSTGRFHLVGTPIGNLGDLSVRGAETLRAADVVVCEDSRRTGKLLAYLGPGDGGRRARLVVADRHREASRVDDVLGFLHQGLRVCLVTDAGMPTISDPGFRIVEAVSAAGYEVLVVPGPTAVSSALAVSGIDSTRFVFEGFLPRKGGERSRRLLALAAEERTIVLYEAPHRLRRTLEDLSLTLGEGRRAALCRELTKLYEEVERGSLADLVTMATRVEPRGEYVIVVEGSQLAEVEFDDEALVVLLEAELESGLSRRDAVAAVVLTSGQSKRRVYDLALGLGSQS